MSCQAGARRNPVLYDMELSLSLDYLTWDFQRDICGDLNKAEK
jgi:hypothetical protein